MSKKMNRLFVTGLTIILFLILFLIHYSIMSNFVGANIRMFDFYLGFIFLYLTSIVFLVLSYFGSSFFVCILQKRRIKCCPNSMTGLFSLVSIAAVLSGKCLASFYFNPDYSMFSVTVYLPAMVIVITTVLISWSLTKSVKKQRVPEFFKWAQTLFLGLGSVLFFHLLHGSVYLFLNNLIRGETAVSFVLMCHLPGSLLSGVISLIVNSVEKSKKEQVPV